MNIDKLDGRAFESRMSVPAYLSEVIRRGWAAFYAIKPAQTMPPQTYGRPQIQNSGNTFLDMLKDET